MKRAFLLSAAAMATLIAMPGTARACQYCRAAPTDPEAARMAGLIHGSGGGVGKNGAFPLDATLGQYQAAPVSGELKTAPEIGSIATSASALVAPGSGPVSDLVVVHRAVPPPTAVPVKPAVADHSANAAAVRWSDLGLLGLAAVGGIFCWRTRR